MNQETIFSRIWSRICGTVAENVRERIQNYINGLLKKFVRAAISITILTLGFVYVTLGFVKAVATLIPEWSSFLLVGTLLILFGVLSAKLAMK